MPLVNFSNVDFDQIKTSIRDYLRANSKFTDYDYEGSGLSYLVDVLSYNTYYSSFMANMSMNEAFISSSTVRDNVVNIAKLLSYTPTSITCSKACIYLKVQTNQTGHSYPYNITLQKGPVATGSNRTWNVLSPVTVEVNQTTVTA